MKPLLSLFLGLILLGCNKSHTIQKPSVTDCDSNFITYAKSIKPILKTNCYDCHSSAVTVSNPSMDFENFANLKSYMDLHFHLDTSYGSQFYNNINHSIDAKAMPPNKKLSTCELRTIKIWIDAGALGN